MRLLYALLFLLTSATATLGAAAKELTVALHSDQPPFVYRADEDNTLSGFDVEMARALCETMQATCTLLPLANQSEMFAALKNGTADMLIAVPLPLADEQGFIVSERYYKYGARFVRIKGDKAKISYKKMAGKGIAVVKDTMYDHFATKKFNGALILRYDDFAAATAALESGEAEYLLGSRAILPLWAAEHEGYEVAGPNYSTAQFFSDAVIAMRDEQLRERVNNAIQTTRQNGRYKELSARFFRFNIYGR